MKNKTSLLLALMAVLMTVATMWFVQRPATPRRVTWAYLNLNPSHPKKAS